MNLSISKSESSEIWWTPGHYIMIGVVLTQGALTVSNNALLLATILYQNVLRRRKEFIVVFSVALADCLYGLVLILGSIDSLYGFVSGSAAQPVMRQKCLRHGMPLFAMFASTLQASMLLMQSSDRLLAISKPLYYLSKTVSYSWALCLTSFIYSLVQTGTLFVLSIDNSDNRTFTRVLCIPQTTVKTAIYTFWHTSHIGFGLVSVLLFGLVLLLYRKHANAVIPEGQRDLQEQMSIQRKVTKSMAYSCLATLGLFVCPRIINLLIVNFVESSTQRGLVRLANHLLYNLNPALNYYIYSSRHEVIRKGLSQMLKCQQFVPAQPIRTEAYEKNDLKEDIQVEQTTYQVLNNATGKQRVDAKHLVVKYNKKGPDTLNFYRE